eukprot:9469329-Pyramimonas_sp.AAC.2
MRIVDSVRGGRQSKSLSPPTQPAWWVAAAAGCCARRPWRPCAAAVAGISTCVATTVNVGVAVGLCRASATASASASAPSAPRRRWPSTSPAPAATAAAGGRPECHGVETRIPLHFELAGRDRVNGQGRRGQ